MEYVDTTNVQNTVNSPNTDDILTNAMHAWYKSIEKYSFSDPKFDMLTGSATQLIWKDTFRVGCAVQLCKETPGESQNQRTMGLFNTRNTRMDQVVKHFYFAVCSFYPAGNLPGMFRDNVFPV